MAIFRSFGLPHLANTLAQDGVHDPSNILSLELNCYMFFDSSLLWLESTEQVNPLSMIGFLGALTQLNSAQENRYRICVARQSTELLLDILDLYRRETDAFGRRYVTFHNHHPPTPLPSPELLALHAVCARVAHMSGAVEAFREFDDDVEETSVLAFDGSSAPLLSSLLAPFAAIHAVA